MVNSEFSKDISKHLDKTSISTELEPGATPRRYEPSGGIEKHNKKIHSDSEYADKYKDLPFSFSKPATSVNKRTVIKSCSNCGEPASVHENCVGIVCSECKQYASVVEVE